MDVVGSCCDHLVEKNQLTNSLNELNDKYQKLNKFHLALLKIAQLSAELVDIDTLYQQIHQIIKSLINADNFYIVQFNPDDQHLEFVYMVDQRDLKPLNRIAIEDFGGTLTAHIINSGQPLLATPETFKQMVNDKVIKPCGTIGNDWLVVPLIQDGTTVGVIAVQSYTEQTRYSQQDQELLQFCARHIVAALNNKKNHQQLQEAVELRTAELKEQIRERENSELLQESLLHISELNSKKLSVESFYDQVRNIIGQLLSCSNFYVAKYDRHEQQIEFVYFVDQLLDDTSLIQARTTRPAGDSLTDYVIRQSKPILLTKEQMFELYLNGDTREPSPHCHSWLGVPLISQGETIGVLVVQSYNEQIIFSETDAEILKHVSHHVTTAIKRREAIEFKEAAHEMLEQKVQHRTQELKLEIEQRHLIEQKLKYSASHDALTSLPNRAYFLETLNKEIEKNKGNQHCHFALLFLDLDRFKSVNDSLGHHAGDLLLQQVAKDLSSMVRESDMVARLGGDEFVILITHLDHKSEASEVANRMTDRLSQPYIIEGNQVQIGTSIGILHGDSRYQDALLMLRDADTALYQAKGAGKGCFEVFDTGMQQNVLDAINLEAAIREGLEKGEFEPYFQPIIDLKTNKIVGFEALARWHSSKRGVVLPNDFIPQAEESSIIGDIDLQILAKAIRQLKQWQIEFNAPNLYISSNFDYSQFFDKSMPGFVASLLQHTKLNPSCLVLELTERGLLDNDKLVIKNMLALKKIGVKLALDDFGTGYSSLSYLYLYPIDILKIDRSFILDIEHNPRNKAIVKTIIDLADNLNMLTIAEGIESAYEANYLTDLSSTYGQGFHYSKPISARQAQQVLQTASL